MIIVLITTIMLTAALLILQNKRDSNIEENIENIDEGNGENFLETYGKTEKNKVDRQAYTDVSTCARKYLEAINMESDTYYTYDQSGNQVLAINENKIKENIYNLLSKNYISQNQITIENVCDKIETLQHSVLFVPLEIAIIQDTTTVKSFAISGLLESPKDYRVIEKKAMIVNIDMQNDTYSIQPIKGEVTNIQEVKVSEPETEIIQNENNYYAAPYVNDETTIKDYTNLYKRLALGNPEKMYELLDQEYKKVKFGSLENFKRYVETNKTEIIGINPQQYQVIRADNDETQYIIIDQNGAYYIVRERGVLDYNIILDTYTINIPEITAKYHNSTDEQKVLFNIQKFFEAVNKQDYHYAYSKLDETFKSNNFKTIEEFSTYIKKNFFDKNKLAAGKVEKQNNIYLYDISISDATNKETEIKKKNFVMQLKEGTDFVMSFVI